MWGVSGGLKRTITSGWVGGLGCGTRGYFGWKCCLSVNKKGHGIFVFSHRVLPISPLNLSRIFEERDGHEKLKNSHGQVMRKNDNVCGNLV